MWDETRGRIIFDFSKVFSSEFKVVENLIGYIPDMVNSLGILNTKKKDYKITDVQIVKKQKRQTNRLIKTIITEFPLILISHETHGQLQISSTQMKLRFGDIRRKPAFLEEEEEDIEKEDKEIKPIEKKLPKEGWAKETLSFIKEINPQIILIITYLTGLLNIDPKTNYELVINFPWQVFDNKMTYRPFTDINSSLASKFSHYKQIKTNFIRFQCIDEKNEHKFTINKNSKIISYQSKKECIISEFNIMKDIKEAYAVTKQMLETIKK